MGLLSWAAALAMPTTQAPMNRGLKLIQTIAGTEGETNPTTQAPMNRGLKHYTKSRRKGVVPSDNPSPDE